MMLGAGHRKDVKLRERFCRDLFPILYLLNSIISLVGHKEISGKVINLFCCSWVDNALSRKIFLKEENICIAD